MKIEVNLNEIFCDEDGNPAESIEESIRRQIIDKLTGDMRKRLSQRVDEELGKAMSAMVKDAMATRMDGIIGDIMDATYTPVDRYGQKGQPTTFRAAILHEITQNLTYSPKQWSSEENAFTKAVKSIVEKKTGEIQKAITDQVDAKFKEDAIAFAVKRLSERLGIAK